MNNPADPMAELYELCEYALRCAKQRPLTEYEIHALRYAAAIPEGAPRPVTVAKEKL